MNNFIQTFVPYKNLLAAPSLTHTKKPLSSPTMPLFIFSVIYNKITGRLFMSHFLCHDKIKSKFIFTNDTNTCTSFLEALWQPLQQRSHIFLWMVIMS